MNYILFLTLIVILFFYVYYGFFKNEPFICFKGQLLQYVDDNNYNSKKDGGIMNDYDKNITFEKIEYENLENRIISNKQESMTNQEIKDLITSNLNYDANTKSNDNYSIQKKELSIIQIDAILNIVFLNNRYIETKELFLNNEEIDNNKYSYYLIKNFLLKKISEAADSAIFKNEYIYSTNFKLINDQIISYKSDYYNNFEEYEIQMIIYRDNKDINYTIYINILFDNQNIKYYIKKIFIVGVNIKEKIVFQDLFNNKVSNYEKHNYRSKNFKKDEEKIQQFLEDDKYMRSKYKEEDRGHCFFKRNVNNKIFCESVDENGTGVWDKSCNYNEDCPYYKRNRNYPNSRGGCINGYCEMPINLKRFGYKQINDAKVNDIICYNCKRDENQTCIGLNCNKCCEDQKNKSKYPNLDGPDYAFEKDFSERIKYNKIFRNKNVSPIKLIS
jgi:hypothetical protein